MTRKRLICVACGAEQGFAMIYSCPVCGGILDVIHDGGFSEANMIGLAPEMDLLAGNTPLLAVQPGRLVDDFGGRIWLKDETRNPSGSFKDRHIAAALAEALRLGAPGVVCASSGNAGASAAAYAARADLPAIIVVPERTPAEKLTQIAAYGARLVKVRGNYSYAYRLGEKIAREAGYVNLTTTFLNPLGTDGLRRVGHEIFRQLDGQVPDWVIIPTGAGPLVKGVFQGFADMGKGLPRLVAVQAEGCAPIVRAYEAGESNVRAWGEPATFASGISDPLVGYEKDGTFTLDLVRKCGGIALSVSDDEIREAMRRLATRAGLFVEPTGASAVAAVAAMARRGLLRADQSVVCMLSGHGFKDIKAHRDLAGTEGITVAPDAPVEAVLGALAD